MLYAWHAIFSDLRKQFMKSFFAPCALFFVAILSGSKARSQIKPTTAKYTKVSSGYLMVLRQGDSVFNEIEAFAVKEKIAFASSAGIGFFGHVQFGYFNKDTKEYEPKDFSDVEAVSLTGSIAWENNQPSVHLHGVVGDKDMNTFGGHILRAAVGNGSLEIYIVVDKNKRERKNDPSISAKVLEVASGN